MNTPVIAIMERIDDSDRHGKYVLQLACGHQAFSAYVIKGDNITPPPTFVFCDFCARDALMSKRESEEEL